ncbi:MAG: hypothetical protein MTP17_02170 [Candidatus Midichloria sp.]|nr:MAG: hypothetical protein MTP17_02170 [Candidatus Midichloria sp.]
MLNSNYGVTLTDDCIKNTVDAMLKIQSLYKINCFTNKCAGFATARARDASNVEEVLNCFNGEAGVDATIISQAAEGNFRL